MSFLGCFVINMIATIRRTECQLNGKSYQCHFCLFILLSVRNSLKDICLLIQIDNYIHYKISLLLLFLFWFFFNIMFLLLFLLLLVLLLLLFLVSLLWDFKINFSRFFKELLEFPFTFAIKPQNILVVLEQR